MVDLFVDPGEKHCGIALFNGQPPAVIRAFTLAPDTTIDYLWPLIQQRSVKQCICEEWRVYPGMANWSTCGAAEVIGALRHMCRQLDVPFDTLPARVKKPAEGFVRRKNIKLVGDTVHAKDAELIGWAWVNGARN